MQKKLIYGEYLKAERVFEKLLETGRPFGHATDLIVLLVDEVLVHIRETVGEAHLRLVELFARWILFVRHDQRL